MKLKLLVELDYDHRTMHNNDPESIKWFIRDILMNKSEDGGLLLHSNEMGDLVGDISVLEILNPPTPESCS